MIPRNLAPSQETVFVRPSRILVATDLTDIDGLLPHAIAQAKGCGASLTFIHSVVPEMAFAMEAGYAPYPEPAELDEKVRKEMAKVSAVVEREGLSCDTIAAFGFGADFIYEMIASTGATRLIMGSRGHGLWGQLFLGSVSNELLRRVSIPVFVVGPHALVTPTHTRPERILHPVSLNGGYETSLAIAAGIADWYQAELTLLHVKDCDQEQNIDSARTLAWAETAMMSLLPPGTAGTHLVRTQAVCGHVVTETLQAAMTANSDWIVLGIESGHWNLPFRDSTAYKIIAAARCGVLVVPHDLSQAREKIVNEVPFDFVMA